MNLFCCHIEILVQTFWSKKNCCSKKVLGKKKYLLIELVGGKITGRQNFWLKKMLVRKNLSPNIFGPNRFLVQNNHGSKTISGPKQLWSEVVFHRRLSSIIGRSSIKGHLSSSIKGSFPRNLNLFRAAENLPCV